MNISRFCSLLLLMAIFQLPSNTYANLFNLDETPLTTDKTWLINFDDHSAGKYSWFQHYLDWSGPKWQMGRNLVSVVEGDEAYSGKSLKLRYPKGISSCKGRKRCIFWPVNLGVKLEKLYYGYRFKLDKDFDFIKGGKLPGISGGKANAGGRVPSGKDGWSVRMMWNDEGRLVQYVYHPDQPGKYGDVMFFDDNKKPIERGLWHTIQTLVVLNTPGKKNGRIVTWLDGKKVLEKNGMRFRDVKGLKINRFQFVSFYGGYGPDWAPQKDEFSYIDDVRFSEKPPFYDDN